ncbi:hypothetical protein ACLBKU_06655 [Erythrobacter sp. NE805]|uniref:hypothetical protein n=1 Tax=Erythrobacter sp. NE805 TaxID=3389875 RepID=UPI00396B0A16
MSRTLFENSKAALAFAGLTLLGAVSIIGTSENNGVLPAVVDRIANKPDYANRPSVSEAEREGAQPTDQRKTVEGWNDTPPSVFGDYDPEGATAAGSSGGESGTAAKETGNAMKAPLSPTAIVTN